MIREMIALNALLLVFACIASGAVTVQKTALRQMHAAQEVMESANEIE